MSNVFVVTLLLIGVVYANISCKNDAGQDVDWFIIYKLPVIPNSKNRLMEDGTAYYYFDPSNQTGRLSNVGIDSTNQSLARTLLQIYKSRGSQSVGHLLYNDKCPNEKPISNQGHTKGSICLDKTSGFWLIHSVPNFPDFSEGPYSWPTSGERNGQTLLCVSLRVQDNSFETIVNAMKFNWPHVCQHNIPQTIQAKVPGLLDLVNGKHTDSSSGFVDDFRSGAGQTFTVFAKSAKFNDDVYRGLVAPHFKSNLYTETWQSGRSKKLKSFCARGQYQVENIMTLALPDAIFNSTKDHSKWAVTTNKPNGYICIGDTNRVVSQMKRGGGLVCTQLTEVWRQFLAFVKNVEKCDNEL